MTHAPRLLYDEHLDGTIAVERRLSPPWMATIVDRENIVDCIQAVESHCLMWGGGCNGLVPIARGDTEILVDHDVAVLKSFRARATREGSARP